MRWLFWFLLLLAVVWWVRRRFFAQEGASRPGGEGGRAQRRRGAAGEAEPMVQCAHCGVFVPASEAVSAGGRTFCCVAHREEFARGGG